MFILTSLYSIINLKLNMNDYLDVFFNQARRLHHRALTPYLWKVWYVATFTGNSATSI